MEFRQLEAFVAVADAKSFSKAAEYLYLSQSTISSHIKNLELELQKQLLIRSTKNIQLTTDGSTLLFYARKILETKEVALNAINSSSDAFLHLGASTIPSAYLLPELLSNFRKNNPQVFFDIKQGDSSDTIERVMDGTVDIGFVGRPIESAQYECVPFCSDKLVIVTPSNNYYRGLQRNKCSLNRLLQEPIIMREQGSGTQKAADHFLNTMGISIQQLNVVAQNNDLEAIKQMITNGMGISIFSYLAIQNIAEQGQVLIFPLQSTIHRQFYMVYDKDRHRKSILENFIAYIQQYYNPVN